MVSEVAGGPADPPAPPLVKGVCTKKLGKGRVKCWFSYNIAKRVGRIYYRSMMSLVPTKFYVHSTKRQLWGFSGTPSHIGRKCKYQKGLVKEAITLSRPERPRLTLFFCRTTRSNSHQTFWL